MRGPSWIVIVVAASCGGGTNNSRAVDADVDGATASDGGAIDAPPRTAYACPASVARIANDAPVIPRELALPGPATCNPITQTGCAVGEKCTWIHDQDSPPIGHVGCVPVGGVPVGGACTTGPAGATGYDNCTSGAYCLGGTCRAICDHLSSTPECGAGFTCARYGDTFEVGGTAVAGLCDPSCDPLTQCTSGATPEACGSTNPAMPNRGCFGFDSFACAPASATSLTLTDRQPPRTNASGNPYLNGCAPGFMPLFYSMTGSTQTLCTGLCAALEVDNTPAHAGNGLGDPAAPAKLPTEASAFTGDGTCEVGKKGSLPSSRCRFIWPYLVDDITGELPPELLATGQVDKLGVCMAIDKFMYDANSDGTPDTPYPDCNTLPPRSASTTGDFDDAADWGCQKYGNSQRRAPATGDVWIGREPPPLARHVLLD